MTVPADESADHSADHSAPATADTLPSALDAPAVARRLDGRRPAVFLDYDGVLTPIVPRPEDAVMTDGMRAILRSLAGRCSVCIVSGRDRAVVEELSGVDDLVIAGSHGFDIWDPQRGAIEHEASRGWEDLVAEVTQRVQVAAADIEGTQVEPKHASVALHDRHVAADERPRVAALVDEVLAEHPGQLRVTPGKFVHEIQPKIDWNKGKAVDHLIGVLDLDHPDIVPIYLGDDITDEDAFRALARRETPGLGVLVIDPADAAGRETAATAVLATVDEVGRFLDGLAR
ncbi:trehalose 6-phosphate phosphatase [Actinomycetospora succinea]|uniref:Trehalose 6-phosphate phosphatase n=1 Tax=Actinomycetospora succinea TaxID=663603 RepID=A0A4R6UK00_9PSEU|nr:trehalose-phosphatase [Actinomycetospora succinea]TDQ47290.1 trehalose 6-phosphate phosphatase [Actinomycetospora succinea]